jgi:hypothetical protein
MLVWALKLDHRHRQECEGGCPENSSSGELDDRRRGLKRCAYLTQVAVTLDGKFNRKQTGRSGWEEAGPQECEMLCKNVGKFFPRRTP